MVTFNIHWGKQRQKPTGLVVGTAGDRISVKGVEGVAGEGNYYQAATPKGSLIMADPKTGQGVEYKGDKLGNIKITIPAHLGAMRGLGYPIFIGPPDATVVTWEDLLFPRYALNQEDPYDRIILEGISARSSG